MKSPLRFPTETTDFDNFDKFFDEHIMFGFKPSVPVVDRNSTIVCLGSCFAGNIAETLTRRAFHNTVHFDIAESANSVLSIDLLLQLLRQKYLDGKDIPAPQMSWMGEFVRNFQPEDAYRSCHAAELFIVTLGVSLYRIDERGLPTHMGMQNAKMLDPKSNVAHLRNIIDCIREINKHAKIVLTLSPVPLVGSPFRNMNAFTLDCISKSSLRSALAILQGENPTDVSYWPSFEAIRWYSGHNDIKFGTSDGNPRHVDPRIIDRITNFFVRYYAR